MSNFTPIQFWEVNTTCRECGYIYKMAISFVGCVDYTCPKCTGDKRRYNPKEFQWKKIK